MPGALRIMDPGLSTTLQDLGRRGYQRFGIPASGALDQVSLKIANRLVGNPEGTGALEFTYLGPSFIVEAEQLRVAFVGGEATIRLHQGVHDLTGRTLPVNESLLLQRGDSVCVGSIRDASTLYMAVEGGFDIAPTLGSQSTFLRGSIGGFEGRRLRSGDVLPLALETAPARTELRLNAALPARDCLRILRGPQASHFSDAALSLLCSSPYVIGSGSDRTGMRLEGAALAHARDYNITSDAVVHGSVQVPGDGNPILLLADRQTTGGYPKIATVISADLPYLGRRPIGSELTFQLVDAAQAEAARMDAKREFSALVASIVPVEQHLSLADRLMAGNLVSGVVDAYA